MNLFQLIFKQMRQRSLSTWLTLLSVVLGVGLASTVMLLSREGQNVFVQGEFGFDVVIGPRGSKLHLVMNSVYHVDQPQGNLRYSLYEELAPPGQERHLEEAEMRAERAARRARNDPYLGVVRWAVPYHVGDSFRGYRVMATLPTMFGVGLDGRPLPPERTFEIRPGQPFEFAEGGPFHHQRAEAVLGSEVAARTGVGMGDTIQVQHGLSGPTHDHDEKWVVVGILEPTYTAKDRLVYVPLLSSYAIDEHHQAIEKIVERAEQGADDPEPVRRAEMADVDDEGLIRIHLPRERWMISGIYVKSVGVRFMDLLWYFDTSPQAPATAANPAMVMRGFFNQFMEPGVRLLLAISVLVTIVAGVSILVSIYNSVSARRREIAILRALGATKNRVLAIICLEAGLIGLLGGLLGLGLGRLIGAASSSYFRAYTGQGINWIGIGQAEWIYLGVVVLIALLAGLVPALKAYRTPVATNLVSA